MRISLQRPQLQLIDGGEKVDTILYLFIWIGILLAMFSRSFGVPLMVIRGTN